MTTTTTIPASRPTPAFVGASWTALLLGLTAYCIGLWNATMQLNEKGYYLTLILFGLFAAVSLQKSVRDRSEGVPVTNLYYGISWMAVIICLSFLTIGLWNAGITPSEKGFYAMSYLLALFGSVAVQKNVRDIAMAGHQGGFAPPPLPITGDSGWSDNAL